jgi:lysosomal Pro-X carboxypeptidase
MVLPKFREFIQHELNDIVHAANNFLHSKGFIWEIAPKFQAMVVFAEHRYYGSSLPYGNQSFTKSNIQYLTSEQALADYAYLINYIKKNVQGAQYSPVVAFGGSYGGMLSAWLRMKYSNLGLTYDIQFR